MRRKDGLSILFMAIIIGLTACGQRSDNDSSGGEPSSKPSDIQGTITAISGNQLLIIDKDRNHPDNKTPTAAWVKFESEMLDGIHIGDQVRVWSNGVIRESYPVQTDGVKLEIIASGTSAGDLQGTVTAI